MGADEVSSEWLLPANARHEVLLPRGGARAARQLGPPPRPAAPSAVCRGFRAFPALGAHQHQQTPTSYLGHYVTVATASCCIQLSIILNTI